ncbi:MAG TPA: tetratricopeptide repeat protein [Pyrinomonadaceae bacterium]|nr:tetratricopeptide repeat protein [Pyrinomonadaceae bacterium]
MSTDTDSGDDYVHIEFLHAAERIAANLHGDAKAEVISIIAGRYAKLALMDEALGLAETISDPFTRDHTLSEIAAASTATGAADYVDASLEMIDDHGSRSLAIEEIAVKHAEAGDLEQALKLTDELEDADPALRRIALAAGRYSPRAVELASSITAPELRANTLGQLAALAYHSDHQSEAAELLAECLQAAEEIEFSENRIDVLIGVASLYEEIGDTDTALELLAQAFAFTADCEGLPPSGLSASFPRGEALTQLVESFARLGHFDQADRAAEQIDDPFQFAHASTKEAMEYFRAGQVDQAFTLLSEALELALEEPVYGAQGMLVKDSLLAELAVGFARLGRLEKSFEVAGKLSSESQQFLALGLVGKECALTGNTPGMFRAAEAITDNHSLTSYWLAVTDVLTDSAQTELARQTVLKAAESAETIQAKYEQTESLIEVAYRLARVNDSKGSELFTPALEAISQLTTRKRSRCFDWTNDSRNSIENSLKASECY